MAGDTKDPGPSETAPPIVDDPFPGIAAKLEGINDAVRSVDYNVWGPFNVPAAATVSAIQSGYPRFRVRDVIISSDIAGNVALIVGTERYPFQVGIGVSSPIPFPLVIERGADVSFTTGVAGPTVYAYLVGYQE